MRGNLEKIHKTLAMFRYYKRNVNFCSTAKILAMLKFTFKIAKFSSNNAKLFSVKFM